MGIRMIPNPTPAAKHWHKKYEDKGGLYDGHSSQQIKA